MTLEIMLFRSEAGAGYATVRVGNTLSGGKGHGQDGIMDNISYNLWVLRN